MSKFVGRILNIIKSNIFNNGISILTANPTNIRITNWRTSCNITTSAIHPNVFTELIFL